MARPSRRISNRRQVAWGGMSDDTGTGIIAISGNTLLGSGIFRAGVATGVAEEVITIVRSVGELFLFVAADLASSMQVAVGIIEVSQLQTAATMASPLTNPEASWLWWYGTSFPDLAAAAALDSGAMAVVRVPFDSRAMRILGNLRTIAVLADATIAGVSGSIHGRYAFLLS